MPEWVVGSLCLASGVTAIATGLLLASHQSQRALRIHRKFRVALSTSSEEWGVWFVQGFADMKVGTSLVLAMATLALWIVLGTWLSGIGLSLIL